MDQKNLFLKSEGDYWFLRNREAMKGRDYIDKDLTIHDVVSILSSPLVHCENQPAKLLEIGCSNGQRIEWLEKNAGVESYGIEPSAAAVEDARSRGLRVKQGTADTLDFESRAFDIIIFGFCLYMCDSADLFQIAAEADRVLKPGGWIIVNDFYARAPVERPYHHVPSTTTRKMDYRTMFTWHPDYVCYAHRVVDHNTRSLTDDPNEWAASSVLRKLPSKGAPTQA